MARIRRITPTEHRRSAVCHGVYYKNDEPITDLVLTDSGVRFIIANMSIILSRNEIQQLIAVVMHPPAKETK